MKTISGVAEATHYRFQEPPKPTYKIYVTDSFQIEQVGKVPNI